MSISLDPPAATATLGNIVDLSRYPIDRPRDPRLVAVIARSRNDLATTGCSVLTGFFAPGLSQMQREAAQLAPDAYVQKRYGNPYSSADDPTLPDDHPVRSKLKRTQGFVAADRIPTGSVLKRVFHDVGFRNFVGACLGIDALYDYADPLGQLVLNVIHGAGEHPWHFDTGEFVVSSLLQAPLDGGTFEYCPNIRSPEDENFDAVGRVIRGESRDEVHRLSLRPGDVQFFLGRYSLHRVAPVQGAQPRLSAIFSYARQPGMLATAERTRHLFGRVTDRHLDADNLATRSDTLRD